MKSLVLVLVKKFGTEFLFFLLEYITNMLKERQDNHVGERSVKEVYQIQQRNMRPTQTRAVAKYRQRFGGK